MQGTRSSPPARLTYERVALEREEPSRSTALMQCNASASRHECVRLCNGEAWCVIGRELRWAQKVTNELAVAALSG